MQYSQMIQKKYRPGNREGGFTLVELALVILIGGFILSASATMLISYIKQQNFRTTRDKLEQIDEALQMFLSLNGRYPCPASRSAQSDTAGFGVEISGTDCVAPASPDDTLTATGRDGRVVRIGAVPVRSLNIPDNFIADAWSGRFTYAITAALATPGTYNRSEGGIFVNDSAGNPVVSFPEQGVAHYVLVSHGENSSGAFSALGGGSMPCTSGTLEEENCDDDAVFRSSLQIGTANNANLYDDFVTIRSVSAFGNGIPPGAIVPFNLNSCPDGWVQVTDLENNFIIGVGSDNPSIGDTGGEAENILEMSQMPFQVYTHAINPALVSGTTEVVERSVTPGQPVENRPPYVAYLFCEKT